jgi:protein TonB
MSALSGTSADQYDILGLAPDASDDEIETAFDWLIRQKAYRFDVPVYRWPQRVHEIRTAYATLRDPAKRSIYDRSLRRAAGPSLWPNAHTDVATDSLVRPAGPRQSPEASAKAPTLLGTSLGTDAVTEAPKKPAKRPRPAKTLVNKAGVVAAGNDAAARSPLEPRQKPKKAVKKKSIKRPGVAAPVIVGSTALHKAASTEAADSLSASAADVSNGVAHTAAEPSSERLNPDVEEYQRVAVEEPPMADVQVSAPTGATEWRTSPDMGGARGGEANGFVGYSESDDEQRIPVKHLGAAAAVTVALSVILFASWPREETQSSSNDAAENIRAVVPRSPGAPPPTTLPVIADTVSDSGEILNAEEIAAALADAEAASASLRDWGGADGPPPGEVPTQEADGTPVVDGQAQSSAASAPPTSATGPASQPHPLATAEATGPRPSAQTNGSGAATAQATDGVRANVGTVEPRQPRGTIASPLKWNSGGPTDADNRRGRYRGTVVVQFTVGPEGRITKCAAAQPSGNAKLDAATCRILVETARFTAARDAQGRPVASEGRTTFTWGRGRRPKI